MAIFDMFTKKQKPEPFKEDASSLLPPSKEPQTKKMVVRGAHGRFVSKAKTKTKVNEVEDVKEEVVPKEEVKTSSVIMHEPITATFYGKEIRKIYSNGKWYFSIDDLVALAASPEPDHPVKMKEDFDKIKEEVGKTIDNVIYANEKGCLSLIAEVGGVFPGPITRWLAESATMPYTPKSTDAKIYNN